MRQQPNVRFVLMLAAAAALAFPATGVAQYQTQNSTGRLLDANNRLGSDGINDGRRVEGGVNADDIVYGNVTRGRQFRGNVSSTDPRAFRGNISRPSDNLTRDAGMSVYQRGENYDPSASVRYYGDQRGVRAPDDFARLQPGSTGSFEVSRPVYRIPGDIRMDATIPNPELGMTKPTQYMLPGIERTNPNALGYLPAPVETPEYQDNQQPDQGMLPTRDLMQRLNLDEQQIRRMREEYRRTGESEDAQARNPADVTLAPETPINDPLTSPMNNPKGAEALEGSMNTEQSLRQRLVTAAPLAARQNTQYAALQERLDRFRKRQTMTDEEANRQFMEEWNASQKEKNEKKPDRQPDQPLPLDQTAAPTQQQPANAGDQADEIDQTTDRRSRVAMKDATQTEPKVEGILPPQPDIPLRIASFAEGVKATGLKNLLAEAEKAMHDGKYTQSLDYYDAAAAVAPDNSMVLMGRAIAELGAGYYARSQTHLEQVMQADPALLMARYDLKAFYGDDRMQYISRDLKDLVLTETRQARPAFLLAFVAYSNDSKESAAKYLDMAEQRGGSKEFYAQLREYWQLNPKVPAPTQAPAPQPQK